ncbi:hypothetical protein FRC11_000729, partial [Ceratobasidium sp. 423]
PAIFSTRDRVAHARKRKFISHIFSQQSVILFEPHVRKHFRALCAQWDMICAHAVAGEIPEGRDGKLWFDVLPQFDFLAFDIIGDLAFGASFGTIEAQKDIAPMMDEIGERAQVKYIPAVEVLNGRDDYAGSMGVLSRWFRPIMKRIPCPVSGMAVTPVGRRLKFGLPDEPLLVEEETDGMATSGKRRTVVLEKLMQGKDEKGEPRYHEQFFMKNYDLAAHPECQRRLQVELDSALKSIVSPPPLTSRAGSPPLPPSGVATKYGSVKNLPYLQACINQGLRLHSISAMGLPREIPPGLSLEVCGETFNEGTILSVPSYTIHRLDNVWGRDSEKYRPERWLGRDFGKEFNPFSFGP